MMRLTIALTFAATLIGLPAVAGSAHAGSLFPSQDLPKPPAFYEEGDYVEFKLTGERGMVIATRCSPGARECGYLVRLPKCGNAEWMSYIEITRWIEGG